MEHQMPNPTATACSRTLRIPEIVRMICDQADCNRGRSFVLSTRPQPALVSLARTSKLFSDPALDIIWRDQDSLAPLVKCMPETLWEQQKVRGSKKIVTLRRPIISTDIHRLLFYSVRIKRLTFRTWSDHGVVQEEFLEALAGCLTPHALLPKLSDITWCPKTDYGLPLIHHLFGPQSRKISLSLEMSTPALSIFPYLKSTCSRVSEFSLHVPVNELSIPVMSDVVRGWEHLQSLTIGNLNENGFTHIAQLSGLRKLDLGPVERTELGPPLYLPEFLLGPSFLALEELGITCDRQRFCVGFIRVISSRQLKRIEIHALHDWTALAWEEITQTIHDCLDHEQLDEIEVDRVGEGSTLAETTPYILTSSTLRPLLAFNPIGFKIHLDVDVDDAFLAEIATCWPNLTSLVMGTEILTTRRSRATLNCLIPFSRHCEALQTLGVRMQVPPVPVFSHTAGARISHALDTLFVGTSPINSLQTAQIAAFLSNLFVALQYVFASENDNLAGPFQTYDTNWRHVCELVPVFLSVRQEEEEFWTKEFGSADDSSEEEGEGEQPKGPDGTETNQ